MNPQELVTIGKCTCGHSRAAHERSKFHGCAFCACLQFQLDQIVQEVKQPRRTPGSGAPPSKPSGAA